MRWRAVGSGGVPYWAGTAEYTPAVPPGVLACYGWLRHGRGRRVAVLSCAGAYVPGADGSNECPAGSVRIETEAACRTAVAAAGKTPWSPFVETTSNYPRGCYYFTSNNNAYFNTHAVGAGASYFQLLCAALATTGAREPNH